VGHPNETLTYLLQKAAKRSLHDLEAALADLDLTARQYLVLAMIEAEGSRSQQDLAGFLGIDPTVLVKLVDQLEERGVVKRTRFENDRRQHRITLTTEGKRLLADAYTRQVKAERELTKRIGARRNDLRALLAETLDL
jgi:DNA-binding MarR family transcriptional regulator